MPHEIWEKLSPHAQVRLEPGRVILLVPLVFCALIGHCSHWCFNVHANVVQHVCRYVVAAPGVWPPGAGMMHPLADRRFDAFIRMGGWGNR